MAADSLGLDSSEMPFDSEQWSRALRAASHEADRPRGTIAR